MPGMGAQPKVRFWALSQLPFSTHCRRPEIPLPGSTVGWLWQLVAVSGMAGSEQGHPKSGRPFIDPTRLPGSAWAFPTSGHSSALWQARLGAGQCALTASLGAGVLTARQ